MNGVGDGGTGTAASGKRPSLLDSFIGNSEGMRYREDKSKVDA